MLAVRRNVKTLLLLLLAACGSSSNPTGIAESSVIKDCEHGDVQVVVALNGARAGMERTEDRMTFSVEVSNNSREDITVKAIRVEPVRGVNPTYQLDNTYRAFDQLIPENEDREFELPITGRTVMRDPRLTTTSDAGWLQLAVTVLLEGGTSYRCRFFIRAPVS